MLKEAPTAPAGFCPITHRGSSLVLGFAGIAGHQAQ
jgi:hypothetical protein